MSLESAVVATAGHSRVSQGPTRRRRRALLAGGCALAAVALTLGTAQVSDAAATPAAGWQTYITPIPSGGVVSGIYAPGIDDAWGVGSTGLGTGNSVYMHFNGSGWSSVSGPDIGPLEAIGGTSDSDLWAVGFGSTAHYNGSAWTTSALSYPSGFGPVQPPFDGADQPEIFVAGPDNAYTVTFAASSSATEQLLEHFNGTAWSVVTDVPGVSAGSGAVNEVTGSGPDDVYVQADVPEAGGTDVGKLFHFSGTAWSVESLPTAGTGSGAGAPVMNVTGVQDGLAIGNTASGAAYADKLTGGTWSTAPLPSQTEPVDSDGGETSGTGRVWVATTDPAGENPNELWQWSGSSWKQITGNDNISVINAVANGSGVWNFIYDGGFTGGSPTTDLYDAG